MAPLMSKQWVLEKSKGIEGLTLEDVPVPEVGERDVLVKLHAVSLNYRDVMIATGTYIWPWNDHIVLCSDGAGEVITTGSKVTRFKPGQRVSPTFIQSFIAGTIAMDNSMTELGSRADGVLREYGIFSEEGLVAIPDSLSYAEAATLPCAALTAWNCLFGARRLLPGDTVVTQGTGGVSIFAAQFALAAGAQVISTTSSAAKGKRLKELGVHHVINYVEDPNWGETAKKLSLDGRGADCIIEIGGPSTMGQSFKAAALDGEIAVVGSRGGKGEGDTSLANARSLTCRIRRILVGSRLQFEQMNRAVEVNGIKPVIDGKLFKFEEAESALRYLSEGRAFGKVVVEI